MSEPQSLFLFACPLPVSFIWDISDNSSAQTQECALRLICGCHLCLTCRKVSVGLPCVVRLSSDWVIPSSPRRRPGPVLPCLNSLCRPRGRTRIIFTNKSSLTSLSIGRLSSILQDVLDSVVYSRDIWDLEFLIC